MILSKSVVIKCPKCNKDLEIPAGCSTESVMACEECGHHFSYTPTLKNVHSQQKT